MSTVQLAFGEAGHGVDVVLLHAFPLHRGMWTEVVDGLTDVAHVLTVDLPGFGRSPLPDPQASLVDAADGVVAVLDGLRIERAVVAGLSMGGYVALALAGRHRDRLAGLGLLDTRAAPDDEAGRTRRLDLAAAVVKPSGRRALHGMAEGLLSPHTLETAPQVLAAAEAMIAEADPKAVAWASTAMAARPDTHAVLDDLGVPALVLVGQDDVTTPLAAAQAMADRLGVTPVVVPDAGHLTALEAPDAVTAALRDLVVRCR